MSGIIRLSKQEKFPELVPQALCERWVKDLSSRRLGRAELSVLARGLNFSVSLKTLPMSEATPSLYGLPKIHKPSVPLRPIVSSVGMIVHNVAKFLVLVLSPLAGKTSSFIRDSRDFTIKVRELVLDPGEVMTLYDIKSLFTCIPPHGALDVLTFGGYVTQD